MMGSQAKNKIWQAVLTAVFTFMGLLSFSMMFMQSFYGNEGYYSLSTLLLVEAAAAVIFSASFVFIRKAWISWLLPAALSGIFAAVYGKELIYGFGVLINDVIDLTAGYFETEMYFITMTRSMVRRANETAAVYLFVILLANLYALSFSRKKTGCIPLIVSVFSMYPLVMAMGPSGFWTMFTVAYCVMTAVIMSTSAKNGPSFVCSAVTAAAVGIVLTVTGIVAGQLVPEYTFERPEYFEKLNEGGKELYVKYQNGELAINQVEQFFLDIFNIDGGNLGGGNSGGGNVILPGASGISGNGVSQGSLGQVDKLNFTGKEVMSVTVVPSGEPLYIKGFIGQDYSSKGWSEPDMDDDCKNLMAQGIHSQDFVGQYLDLIRGEAAFELRYTSMRIEQDHAGNRQMMPLYPLVDFDVAYVADEGYVQVDSSQPVYFYDMADSVIPQIDYYAGSDILGELAEKELLYRTYAYSRYLEVNTPVADELQSRWGMMPSETAEDRYKTACAVRKYLAENCTYTTSPGRVPSDKDFVEYFLNETQEGYCTYFATAAVMMLRSAGIPTRYVEGYASDTKRGEGTDEKVRVESGCLSQDYSDTMERAKRVSIVDSDAHAWIEYYVDGVGWIDFEVTPGNYDEVPAETETATEKPTEQATTAPEQTTNATEATTAVAPTKSPAKTEAASGGTEAEQKGGIGFSFRLSAKAEKIILITVSCMVVAGIFCVIFACRHKTVENRRNKMYDVNVDEKLRNNNVICIHREYMRLLRHFGYRIKPSETEAAFGLRMSRECRFAAGKETEIIAAAYEAVVFGKEATGAETYEKVYKAYESIRSRMYESIGCFRRFIYRFIFNI